MFRTLAACLGLLLSGAPAMAHEYWIMPERFLAEAGDTVAADLRVGQMFSGEAYPWLRRSYISATMVGPDGAAPLTGREGDLPALKLPLGDAGLYAVNFHAAPSYVVFDTFDEFAGYLDYEGLSGIADRHKARALPDAGFGEEFIRNARTLVQVGPAQADQTDTPSGMPFDLVAETNPYLPDLTALPVRLTWNGQPSADTQIAIFVIPPDGTAPDDTIRTLLRTDADGRATIPLDRDGRYMLAAVHIDEVPEKPESIVVWRTHWATLTFARGPAPTE